MVAALAPSGLAHAAPGDWLAAVNTGAWFETFDQDQGGIGTELQVAKTVRKHVFVGGRFTGLRELDLGNSKENVAHVIDLGPSITVNAKWSRFWFEASAAALASHVKYYDEGWKSSWTPGLGLDAGLTTRPAPFFGIGVHVLQNVNRYQSATGIGLRVEFSLP